MALPKEQAEGWSAIIRLEDKLTDFMEEAREILREQQRFMSELATRQAVVEERLRRAESDLSVTMAEATKAHQRIDSMANVRSEEVGMRKGMLAGITLVSSMGGGGVVLGLFQMFGG